MTSPDPFASPTPPSPPPAGTTPPAETTPPSPPPAGATPPGPPPAGTPPGPPPAGETPPVAPASARQLTEARPPQAGIVVGIILIVVGGVFLVARLADLTLGPNSWPLWIIVPGLGLFLASFAIAPRGGLGLAIPGAIITIVGVILWVQETYGLYATWAYAWALVAPTGPGLAMLAYGVVKGDGGLAVDGLRTTLVGLGLFIGFGLFFEGVVGLSGERVAGLDQVLPFVVIGLGALLVVLSFAGPRRPQRQG